MFYILAGKCIIQATAPSSLSVWEFALMNDLIACQRWIRLKIFLRWKDYYLMRKALIWRCLQRTEGLVFVIWKSSQPKCPLINANWNCVGRSCGSLWAVNVCRSTQVTYGSTRIFALSELLWRFQMDWWFNSRWLNILSSFCSQGGLHSRCHNSQWFIFSDPISLPCLVGLFIYLAWSLICHLWNTGVLRGASMWLQSLFRPETYCMQVH